MCYYYKKFRLTFKRVVVSKEYFMATKLKEKLVNKKTSAQKAVAKSAAGEHAVTAAKAKAAKIT